MSFSQSAPIDANAKVIPTWGFQVSASTPFTGNNTTVNTPVFTVTGSCLITALYATVTTTLGANHTAAFWRLNDQTAQIALTLATGTTLSAATSGSLIIKTGLVGAALTYKSAAAGYILEPTTLETLLPSPILVASKTALTTTTIEYSYATTDAPTTGTLQHWIYYQPLSFDGAIGRVSTLNP